MEIILIIVGSYICIVLIGRWLDRKKRESHSAGALSYEVKFYVYPHWEAILSEVLEVEIDYYTSLAIGAFCLYLQALEREDLMCRLKPQLGSLENMRSEIDFCQYDFLAFRSTYYAESKVRTVWAMHSKDFVDEESEEFCLLPLLRFTHEPAPEGTLQKHVDEFCEINQEFNECMAEESVRKGLISWIQKSRDKIHSFGGYIKVSPRGVFVGYIDPIGAKDYRALSTIPMPDIESLLERMAGEGVLRYKGEAMMEISEFPGFLARAMKKEGVIYFDENYLHKVEWESRFRQKEEKALHALSYEMSFSTSTHRMSYPYSVFENRLRTQWFSTRHLCVGIRFKAFHPDR